VKEILLEWHTITQTAKVKAEVHSMIVQKDGGKGKGIWLGNLEAVTGTAKQKTVLYLQCIYNDCALQSVKWAGSILL